MLFWPSDAAEHSEQRHHGRGEVPRVILVVEARGLEEAVVRYISSTGSQEGKFSPDIPVTSKER